MNVRKVLTADIEPLENSLKIAVCFTKKKPT